MSGSISLFLYSDCTGGEYKQIVTRAKAGAAIFGPTGGGGGGRGGGDDDEWSRTADPGVLIDTSSVPERSHSHCSADHSRRKHMVY